MGGAKVSLRLGITLFLSTRLTQQVDLTIIAAAGNKTGPRTEDRDMTAVIPLDPVAIALGPHAPLALVVIVAWGLANCFLGYPLFRVVVALHGATAGWVLGAAMAQWLRTEPTSADYLVAGGAMAVLAGMGAWFACRAAFVVGVFWLTTAVIAQRAEEPRTAIWLVSGLLGAVAGVVTYRLLRGAIILITATIGAAAAILATALLCIGGRGWGDLVNKMFAQQNLWLAWLLAILAVVLACVGIMSQKQLSELVSDVFMPRKPGRRPTRRLRGTRAFPKFTKP